MKVVDLPIQDACLWFPDEAKACNLLRMTKSWRGRLVRCIVLANARLDPDTVNLSIGCFGIVGRFELRSEMARFCHRKDLGKTVTVVMPTGETLQRSLIRSWPPAPLPTSAQESIHTKGFRRGCSAAGEGAGVRFR